MCLSPTALAQFLIIFTLALQNFWTQPGRSCYVAPRLVVTPEPGDLVCLSPTAPPQFLIILTLASQHSRTPLPQLPGRNLSYSGLELVLHEQENPEDLVCLSPTALTQFLIILTLTPQHSQTPSSQLVYKRALSLSRRPYEAHLGHVDGVLPMLQSRAVSVQSPIDHSKILIDIFFFVQTLEKFYNVVDKIATVMEWQIRSLAILSFSLSYL